MNTTHFLPAMSCVTGVAARADVAGKLTLVDRIVDADIGIHYFGNASITKFSQSISNPNLGGLQSYFQTNTVQQNRNLFIGFAELKTALNNRLAAVSYNNQQ